MIITREAFNAWFREHRAECDVFSNGWEGDDVNPFGELAYLLSEMSGPIETWVKRFCGLYVDDEGIHIDANEGSFHAIEAISQLVSFEYEDNHEPRTGHIMWGDDSWGHCSGDDAVDYNSSYLDAAVDAMRAYVKSL